MTSRIIHGHRASIYKYYISSFPLNFFFGRNGRYPQHHHCQAAPPHPRQPVRLSIRPVETTLRMVSFYHVPASRLYDGDNSTPQGRRRVITAAYTDTHASPALAGTLLSQEASRCGLAHANEPLHSNLTKIR